MFFLARFLQVKPCEDENEEQNTSPQHDQREKLLEVEEEVEGKANNNNYKYNLYAISVSIVNLHQFDSLQRQNKAKEILNLLFYGQIVGKYGSVGTV